MDDVLVLHVDDQLHGGPCLKRNGSRELQALQQSTLTLGACERQAEGRGGKSGLDETEKCLLNNGVRCVQAKLQNQLSLSLCRTGTCTRYCCIYSSDTRRNRLPEMI